VTAQALETHDCGSHTFDVHHVMREQHALPAAKVVSTKLRKDVTTQSLEEMGGSFGRSWKFALLFVASAMAAIGTSLDCSMAEFHVIA